MHMGERGEGGGGAPHVPPQKPKKKLDHQISIKHENRGPPPRFSHNPKYPPQKNLKMIVH